MKTLKIQAPEDMELLRIDAFLSNQDLNISRTTIKKLIKEGKVHLEGKQAKPSDKVHPGQTCTCEIDEEVVYPPQYLEPQKMDLDIIYEDESILAINKIPGLAVHPGAGRTSNTLANGLLAYTQNLSDTGGWDRPGIVHRLDKDTSGVILTAKTNAAHANLSEQFAERKTKKRYWTLIWGELERSNVTVDAPIGRQRNDRRKMSITPKGKKALTIFEHIKSYGFCSEVYAYPQTGRTHQIRTHLAHIGHPVMGDTEYGGSLKKIGSVQPVFREKVAKLMDIINRQMLHAQIISFTHPVTDLQMNLEAKFYRDIVKVKELLDTF